MSYTLISRVVQKARKEHKCIWCGEPILLGEDGLQTLRPDQARRYATEAEAAHVAKTNALGRAIDLEDLEHEQSFADKTFLKHE